MFRKKIASLRYDLRQPIFSIHVPKAAGSSALRQWQEWFGPENVLLHYPDEAAGQPPVKYSPAGGQVVHGHTNRLRGFGIWDYYPEARQFVIFLRDPFEQHVSLYFYLKRHRAAYHFEGRQMNIQDIAPTVNDFLRLVGEDRSLPFAQTFRAHLPVELDEKEFQRWARDYCLHVGVSEVLAESLAALGRKLGKEILPGIHENASPHDEAVDPALRAAHVRDFACEHKIYQWVVAQHG